MTVVRRLGFMILCGVLALPAAGEDDRLLDYIDTGFENASPLWWEETAPGRVEVHLVYDHERGSPNRAAGHWHFKVHARPGTRLEFVLENLSNVWNGRPGYPLSERTLCRVSEDGRNWRTVETEVLEGDRLRFEVTLRDAPLHVAHLEPYRLGDLERLLDEIRGHPLVSVEEIGRTVQGRPLEIVRIGREEAPHHVFLRARAHPWESGGSWVVQGLVRGLLADDPANAEFLGRYAVHILPMANKDGVAGGRTRFNLAGRDLNRNWDRPADPRLAPENHALEQWLERMIRAGRRPGLVIDLHNDQSGRIHVSRPEIELADYLARIERYEALMRKHTWFTEGSTRASFRNPGSIGEGLLERYGVTALVQELNANWIEGLQQPATGANWELLGRQYRRVFHEFLAAED